MSAMVAYEQPLNEKIRLLFRLENLFRRFSLYLEEGTSESSYAALLTLLELHDLSSRLDVKSAVLKVIDRQSIAIRSFQDNEDVNEKHIEAIVTKLEEKARELYSFHGQLGQHLKAHHFLNTVKQRMTVPGGVNGFDIPIFNFWLSQSDDIRLEQLNEWIAPYKQSREAVMLVMDLIRGSAQKQSLIAKEGFYQETMEAERNTQLLRVELPSNSMVYPEVSAGKQRFSIRFVSALNLNERARQVQEDQAFDLILCGF